MLKRWWACLDFVLRNRALGKLCTSPGSQDMGPFRPHSDLTELWLDAQNLYQNQSVWIKLGAFVQQVWFRYDALWIMMLYIHMVIHPMIYLEAFYMGITIFFASYKAKPKKTCRKPKPKMMKHQKNIVFVFCFFEILIDHIHSNKQKNTSFLFFHFKTKKPRENQKSNLLSQNQTLSHMFFLCFFGLLEFFVFFGLSIVSHHCHLCPYACVPCRSWEVKLWSKFLTQELAHYVRLGLA